MRSERQLQELGVFVHGALCALHCLGVVYNVKRRNWWDAAAHLAATIYDAHAARKHYRKVWLDREV